MASEYRVFEKAANRAVALPLLKKETPENPKMCALFERECYTLVQSVHPRLIEVYDYGVDMQGAYYTVELLDGEDLRKLAPLDWRQPTQRQAYRACARLPPEDAAEVQRAYLTTPQRVGRAALVKELRKRIVTLLGGHSRETLLFEGASGLGRSPMLMKLVLEGTMIGVIALTAEARGDCGAARELRLVTVHVSGNPTDKSPVQPHTSGGSKATIDGHGLRANSVPTRTIDFRYQQRPRFRSSQECGIISRSAKS
jgi:hypothetical protein